MKAFFYVPIHLELIFTFLDDDDIARIRRVCSTFRHICNIQKNWWKKYVHVKFLILKLKQKRAERFIKNWDFKRSHLSIEKQKELDDAVIEELKDRGNYIIVLH